MRLFPDLDANHDGLISRDEGETCRPVVEGYLQSHLFLDIDGQEATFGGAVRLGWPNPDVSPIVQADWHQSLIQFSFRGSTARRPRQVQVTADVFIELGTNHKIIAEFRAGENDLVRHPAVLTLDEPDYLFDVDYALEHVPGAPRKVQPAAQRTPWIALVGAGALQLLTPVVLLLLLTSLIPARGKGAALFWTGELISSIPASLLGLPVPLRTVQAGMALALIAPALLKGLLPARLLPRAWSGLFLAGGLFCGLRFAAGLREVCLAPLRPAEALLPYQAGVGMAGLAAAGLLYLILTILGTWRFGDVLPRVLIALSGIAGVLFLIQAYR
jgi:hypothetical protein